MTKLQHYYKAVVAFVGGLGGIWVVAQTLDFSDKQKAWGSVVAIATAVGVYLFPNKPKV